MIRILLCLFFAFLLGGCGGFMHSGVVHETIVGKDVVYDDEFSDEHRDQLNRFKMLARQKSGGSSIGIDLNQAERYTVEEYLRKFPKYGSSFGVDYTVGGNDILRITVYDEDDLSRDEIRVSRDGYISFPLIGRIKVEGLTPSQIQQLIADDLAAEKYLLKAHVQVMIKEFGSTKYSVLGAVENSGIHFLKAKETILDGISSAGGVDYENAGKNILIIRTDRPNPLLPAQKTIITVALNKLLREADMVSNIHLKDQDVIYVPEAEQFYIMGEVNDPGVYKFTDQTMTLVEGIGLAGGFTPIASRNSTRIIRIENGVEKIITVNVDAITKKGQKIQDVSLRPGDIIIVPESFF